MITVFVIFFKSPYFLEILSENISKMKLYDVGMKYVGICFKITWEPADRKGNGERRDEI